MTLSTFSMEGVALVILGSFSPLQLNPEALASQNLLEQEDMNNLTDIMATEDLVHFKLPWISLTCENQRLQITSTDQPQIRILDFVLGILQANTTIQCNSFGLNWLVHTSVMDKKREQNLRKITRAKWKFDQSGSATADFRSFEWMIKSDSLFESRPCLLKIQPSVMQNGALYFALNDNLQISKEESLNTNYLFAKLQERWDASKREAYEVFGSVWDSL